VQDKKQDQWNPSFFKQTPLFWPITPTLTENIISSPSWPTLDQCNQLLSNNIPNKNQKIITFVEQASTCHSFEEEYEPRIFLSGEVQTRLHNWHDFLQVLVWKTFPKTKALLNEIHYSAAIERYEKNDKQRSKKENFVTLFDECGSIIVSADKNILELVENFEWNKLFVENKVLFDNAIDCITFGHAMYEKALSPYIGMTSHCLLLQVDTSYFELTPDKKTSYIDEAITNHIKKISGLNTRSLTPLPILGVPDWHNNQTDEFYKNTSYFRPGRKNKNMK